MLPDLCSAFSSLLKMAALPKEPESSSSESEFLLRGGDEEKGGWGDRQRNREEGKL